MVERPEEGGLGGLFWAINIDHCYMYDINFFIFFCSFLLRGRGNMKFEFEFISTQRCVFTTRRIDVVIQICEVLLFLH